MSVFSTFQQSLNQGACIAPLEIATEAHRHTKGTQNDQNRLRLEDWPVHCWYRFVLSFPPHLVRSYLEQFGVSSSQMVLDPFCGTGTTLVECKKLGVQSVGIEPNPMAYLASMVKVDWSADPVKLLDYANQVVASAKKIIEQQGINIYTDLPLYSIAEQEQQLLSELPAEQLQLLLRNSISPLPLHKTLLLLEAIHRQGDHQMQQYGRLALANALVQRISNLKFGPEVGTGKIKEDAPVFDAWLECIQSMVSDMGLVKDRADVTARIIKGDSRQIDRILEPQSVDAVITSPPYPNEKDYTRTTRLESVILGLIRNKQDLRSLKQDLIRSNTRGVYKADTDDLEVEDHTAIQDIAEAIERRRVELRKTSGFERLYPRLTKLYFGGMARHLASLRSALKPGAQLAYVVGDQASYLRVMIRTGHLLAELAQSLNYTVTGIDLFRTRLSTVTGEQLREEVVLLEWSGR